MLYCPNRDNQLMLKTLFIMLLEKQIANKTKETMPSIIYAVVLSFLGKTNQQITIKANCKYHLLIPLIIAFSFVILTKQDPIIHAATQTFPKRIKTIISSIHSKRLIRTCPFK